MTSTHLEKDEYVLIIGSSATDIFDFYGVSEMHGLSKEMALNRIQEGGTYIDGLCNVHPSDSKRNDTKNKPFIFLNLMACDAPDYKIMGRIMHECMHMAGMLWDGCWDSHEEEMISWAESEAISIFENHFK